MSKLNLPHPGTTIREQVIEPLGLSISEAAAKLGMSRTAFSRVLNGKAGISADLAIRLEMAGISTARFWMALQADYDLEIAKQRKQPDIERLADGVVMA